MRRYYFFILFILVSSLSWNPNRVLAQDEGEENVGQITTGIDPDIQQTMDELMRGSIEEWERVQQRMKEWLQDSLDEDMWRNRKSGRGFMPPTDFEDRGTEYVVMLDLPGMEKKDIDVEVRGRALIVSGERLREVKVDRDYQKGGFYRYGRQFGKFKKTVRLPDDAKASEIAAKYDNGVLEVRVGKQAAAPVKPAKKILIQ